MHTTLNQLREWNACTDGYRNVVKGVGVDFDHDSPILLSDILESNNRSDVFWILRRMDLTDDQNSGLRVLAITLPETVLPLFEERHPGDSRPRDAIEGAKSYLTGDITIEELMGLRRAADAAADAAAAYAAAAYAAAYAADTAAAYAAADAAAAADTAAAYAAADADAEIKTLQFNLLKDYLVKYE